MTHEPLIPDTMRLRTSLALFLTGLPLGACSSEPTANSDTPAPTVVTEATLAPVEALPEPSPLEAVEMEGLVPLHRVGDLWLGGQPDEVALEALAAEGVRTVIDLRRPQEERGFDEADVAENVLELDYLPLGFGGPEPLTDEIFQRARRAMATAEEGALLHCASSNRVGAVWLARRVLDEGVQWDTALEEAHAVGLRSPNLEEAARAYVLGAGNQEFGRLKLAMREQLPELDVISVAELAERFADGDTPLLIDVRTPEEYAVSHLPGAQHAEDEESVLEVLQRAGGVHSQREVIFYCSIGYRSGHLAEQLRRAGLENARNLEGSIFEWANAGHPVHRDGQPTDEVHPYDEEWGRFLERERWSELR